MKRVLQKFMVALMALAMITQTLFGGLFGSIMSAQAATPPVLTLTKQVDKVTAAPGDVVTYTLNYANTGSQNATAVSILDMLDPSLLYPASSSPGFYSSPDGPVFDLGTVAKHTSGSVSFTAQIDPNIAAGTNVLNNSAQIWSTEVTTPVVSNTVSTTVNADYTLSLTKTASPDPVAPGGDILYTLTYSNTGNITSPDLYLNDAVPTNTTFVSATDGGTETAGNVSWYVGMLAPGTTLSTTLDVMVDPSVADGTIISNTATLTDNANVNVSSSVDTTVTAAPAPIITLSKTASPDPVTAGNDLTYTIDFANIGTAEATNVVITDPIPTGTTYVDASATNNGIFDGTQITWNVGGLGAGATDSASFSVTTDPGLADGSSISNTVTLTSDQATKTFDTTTSVVAPSTGSPILNLSKDASANPVVAGQNLTYTLSYDNSGDADATNVVISDVIPTGAFYIVGSATNGGTFDGTQVSWDLGTLAPSASGSMTFDVQTDPALNNGDVISNQADITSDQTSSSAFNNVDVIRNAGTAFLTIDKSVDLTDANPGDTLTYTLAYSNTGDIDATGAIINDDLNPNLIYISSDPVATLSGTLASFDLGTVAAGSSGSVTFQAMIDPNLSAGVTSIDNFAVISSNETADLGSNTVTTNIGTPNPNTSSMQIEKTVSSTDATLGDELTYTVSYRNVGDATANGVTITDAIDSNLENVSVNDSGNIDNNVISWNIGDVAANTDWNSVSFTAFVGTNTPDGYGLTNRATLTSDTESMDSNEVSTAISSQQNQDFVLGIDQSASANPVKAGDTLTFYIHYENSGLNTNDNVIVTSQIPDNADLISGSDGYTLDGSTIRWEIGSLDPGQGGDLSFEVNTSTSLNNGDYLLSSALVSSDQTQASSDTSVRVVKPILEISVYPSAASAHAGDDIYYEIKFRNVGDIEATDAKVAVMISGNLVNAVPEDGGVYQGGQIIWNIGSLQPDENWQSVGFSAQLSPLLATGAVVIQNANVSAAETSSDGTPVSTVILAPATNPGTSNPVTTLGTTTGTGSTSSRTATTSASSTTSGTGTTGTESAVATTSPAADTQVTPPVDDSHAGSVLGASANEPSSNDDSGTTGLPFQILSAVILAGATLFLALRFRNTI